jgi:hypothetical protein
MGKFEELYTRLVSEQAVEPPAHREGLKPHIQMVGDIVKRQNITKQSEIINQIMLGITNPVTNTNNLSQYGTELPELVKKIGNYIQQQPTEHRSDIIEHVRQTVTHPAINK